MRPASVSSSEVLPVPDAPSSAVIEPAGDSKVVGGYTVRPLELRLARRARIAGEVLMVRSLLRSWS